MFFLYSVLLTIGFIVLLPRFLFDGLRKGKYAAGFWQRLGYLPNFQQDEKPVLWLHCVSVGEINAARPLVKELLEKYPDFCLVVSTTTKTGQELAREVFADSAALVFYFPLDWRFTVRRALRKIKPSVVLIIETELWFNFLRETHKSGAKIVIVNGRLSEKSVNRYLYVKNFMQRVLQFVDLALMQGNKDAQRIIQLGIRADKVKVTGNIKFDQGFEETENQLTQEFRERFAISENAPLIVAASTHAPEEVWILEAFAEVREKSEGKLLPRLLIAPRHPERFAEVAELIKNAGFKWSRRSAKPSDKDKIAEIILLDSIGELRTVFPLAEIVFVGGSLIPHGGQNILEPAIARKAIATGFYTTNFAEIVREFLAQDALVQLPKLDEREISKQLTEVFSELLQNAERRQKLGRNAFMIMQKSCGATSETIKQLKPFLQVQNKL
ncbi:3-deoxy-D-manno-octulosonic acid transferase [soil metagenome]|nr:3-deoxy-D-manno-octulosonic acid transferase [Acidobacteriota bacterium]